MITVQFRVEGEINGKTVTHSFEIKDNSDGRVTIRPLAYPTITKEIAGQSSLHLHSNECLKAYGPKGGVEVTVTTWRENGGLQTWKTRPDEFKRPIKYGMRDYGYITNENASQFHDVNDCPLHIFDRLPKDQALKLAGYYTQDELKDMMYPFTCVECGVSYPQGTDRFGSPEAPICKECDSEENYEDEKGRPTVEIDVSYNRAFVGGYPIPLESLRTVIGDEHANEIEESRQGHNTPLPEEVEAKIKDEEWRVDVQGHDETQWSCNSATFSDPFKAEAYARDLYSRWTHMESWRIVPADTPRGEPVLEEHKRAVVKNGKVIVA